MYYCAAAYTLCPRENVVSAVLKAIPLSQYSNISAPFEEKGFLIAKGAIPRILISELHRDIWWLAGVMLEEREPEFDEARPAVFVDYLSRMESEKAAAFPEYLNAIGNLRSFERITHCEGIQCHLSELSSRMGSVLQSTRGGLFFNKPGGGRLQYKWHQEWTYFADHDVGLHIWFPLLQNISATGGAMLVAAGTHAQRFEFVPSREPQSFLQNETQFDASRYDVVSCDLDLGDVIIFHHNLVHCTDQSIAKGARVTGLARFVGNRDRKFVPLS